MAELSYESTKEEVAEYWAQKFLISDESKNLIIKEDISGDTLLYLENTDFIKLKLKLGKTKKIKQDIEENKDKFKEKEIKEVIISKSNPEIVKSFFERCLNFKGDLNNLDGKGLIDLDEEGMEKLGLNLGQRRKLPRYIEHFKTLKIEESQEPTEKDEIMVSKDSSEEEVAKFLEMRLKFSKDSIKDPLDNKREEEQKVEKDRQTEKRKFHELKKCKIQPMDVNSKYNIFFIFSIQEKYIKDISLSTFCDISGYFSSSYINYDFLLINEEKKYTLLGEPVKSFIIQVPLEKKIQNLSFTLLFNNNFKEEFNTSIEVEGEDNNYFYLNNHSYDRFNDFIGAKINSFSQIIFLSFLIKILK